MWDIEISEKAAHRNTEPCRKLPYYSRVLNNCTCAIVFFQLNVPYVRSLLGTERLLLWTNFLSCTFILNSMINHSEHFFSNCSNKRKTKTLNLLLFVRLWGSTQFEGNDIHYSVMILKSVSPGYHFNKNTLLHKSYFSVFAYWTSSIKWASSNRVEHCINSSQITSA